jgi:hypothetical protein
MFLGVALAACGQPDLSATQGAVPRQEPSVATPGVHVSGHVEFGVKRKF